MRLESYGLYEAVHPIGEMRVGLHGMNSVKIPVLCPHCLKPGNTQETFPVTLGNWRIRVPISTHPECSSGWRKGNISGSARIWGSGSYICFEFKNPVYSMLFSRINFENLSSRSGTSLMGMYDRELPGHQRSQKRADKNCPRCGGGLMKSQTECPVCHYDTTQKWVPEITQDIAVYMKAFKIDSSFKCPNCGIGILPEKGVKKCGRCNASLKKT